MSVREQLITTVSRKGRIILQEAIRRSMHRASVVLSDWHGPTMATMRVSVSATRIRLSVWRATNVSELAA